MTSSYVVSASLSKLVQWRLPKYDGQSVQKTRCHHDVTLHNSLVVVLLLASLIEVLLIDKYTNCSSSQWPLGVCVVCPALPSAGTGIRSDAEVIRRINAGRLTADCSEMWKSLQLTQQLQSEVTEKLAGSESVHAVDSRVYCLSYYGVLSVTDESSCVAGKAVLKCVIDVWFRTEM